MSNNSNKRKRDERIIRVEEEIRLEENTLQTLLERQEDLTSQLDHAISRRKTLQGDHLKLLQKQRQLTIARTKHLALEQDLKESLQKSRERLLGRSSLNTNNDTFFADDENRATVPIPLTEQQYGVANNEGEHDSSDNHSSTLALHLLEDNNLHSKHDFYHRPRPPNALFTFLPMVESSLALQIMTLYNREASTLDVLDDDGKPTSHRRQLFWNTCLDFVLLKQSRYGDIGRQRNGIISKVNNTISSNNNKVVVDPNVSLCPYELSGICADEFCPYQHSSNERSMLSRELLPLPPLNITKENVDKSTPLNSSTDNDRNVLEDSTTTNRKDMDIDEPSTKPTTTIVVLGTTAEAVSANDDFISLPTAAESDESSSSEEEEDVVSAFLKSKSRTTRSIHFWWGGILETDSGNSSTRSITDALRQLGVSIVKKEETNDSSCCQLPSKAGDWVIWLGQLVDCCRMAIHAGRHEISHPILDDKPTDDDNALPNDMVEIVKLLQAIRTQAFYCDELPSSVWNNSFVIQASLNILSEYLESLHTKSNRCPQNKEEVMECIHLLLDRNSTSATNEGHKKPGDVVEQLRHILLQIDNEEFEELKALILWAKRNFGTTKNEDDSFSFTENNVGRIMVIEDQLLKPCWSIVSSMIRKSTKETYRRNCFKSTMVMGCCILGCLEHFAATVEYGDDALRNANLTAALTSMDSTIHRILKDLSSYGSDLLDLVMAPLISVGAATATFLRMYSVAQNRLEAAIVSLRSTKRSSLTMPYSELLWSQLIHLRMTLPTDSIPESFSGDFFKNNDYKEPSPSCQKDMKLLCEKMEHLGVKLHHLALQGDCNLLSTSISNQSPENVLRMSRAAKTLSQMIFNDNAQNKSSNKCIQLDKCELIHRRTNGRTMTLSSPLPCSILLAGKSTNHPCMQLDLQECQLNSLPVSFGLYLGNLIRLDLSHNSLTNLPSSMKWMRSLKVLILCHNQIRELPDLVSCVDLRSLRATHNCLDKLPLFLLFRCTKIEEIDLSHNHLIEQENNDLFLSKLILNLKQLRSLKFDPQTSSEQDQ